MKIKSSEFIIKTSKYKVKDINLNVAEVGHGKPLVLIHGWGGSWMVWTLLAEELASKYKIYMIDLPGFGDSDSLDLYSVESTTKYIDLFIKKYCPDVNVVIGASGGAFIASSLNRINNNKFSLVLIGPIFKNIQYKRIKNIYGKLLDFSSDSETIHKIFEIIIKKKITVYISERFISSYKFNKLVVDNYIYPAGKKTKGKSYIQMGASIFNYVLDDELKKTKSSILLIFGKFDKFVNPEIANSFVNSSENLNVELSIIDKAGHCVAHEQPEKTGKIIMDFLSNIEKNKSSSVMNFE